MFLRYASSPEGEKPVKRHEWNACGHLAGVRYLLPCVWEYKDKIIFDLIGQVHPYQALAFCKKYMKDECADYELTESENPYHRLELQIRAVNGKLSPGWQSEEKAILPAAIACAEGLAEESAACRRETERLYGHIPFSHYSLRRCELPLPKGEGLQSLKIELKEADRFVPLKLQISLNAGEEQAASFYYPPERAEKRLILSNYQTESTGMSLCPQVQCAAYRFDPPLRPEESPLFDTTAICASSFDGDAHVSPDSSEAASIGIIGGADGPTAVCFGGEESQPVCLAKPGLSDDAHGLFILKGMVLRGKQRQEITFVKRIHKKPKNLKIFIKNLLTTGKSCDIV